MNRWEKIGRGLLLVADELRMQRGAVQHVTSNFGRMFDVLERIEAKQDEICASHQKANRQLVEIEARLTLQERRHA